MTRGPSFRTLEAQRLIEYLSTGETLLFAGAGVSAELGVPTWRLLGTQLVERFPSDFDSSKKAEAERYLAHSRYPELMGWIERNLGSDYLHTTCRDLIRDPGTGGELNALLAKLNFKSVFTTNFEGILARHFREAGTAIRELGNSPRDLGRVDIDQYPCLVYLHSDFSHVDSLILTDLQYSAARVGATFEYLRVFLRSYLATKRFIIVGYSLQDPDIQLVLEELARNNPRQDVPIYAVLADVPAEERQRLAALNNVEVVSYRNASGTHRELVSLFAAMIPYVDRVRRRRDAALDIKRAQALYLWSRLSLAPESAVVQVDALKSVILSQLKGPTPRGQLEAAVAAIVGIPPAKLAAVLDTALRSLAEEGNCVLDDAVVRLSDRARDLVENAFVQHEALATTFDEQVSLDLQTTWRDVEGDKRSQARRLVTEALVDVFSERGLELATAVLRRARISTRGSANLFALLTRAGDGLGSDDLKYRFVRYMSELLTRPRGAQLAYLEHLALAFFSLQSLAMDPDGHKFRDEFLGGRALLVDSNVLIPLLAAHNELQDDIAGMIALARAHKMPLNVTPGVIQEIVAHGHWAAQHLSRYGPKSIQVMQAVEGRGYKRNAFLAGYVRYSVQVGAVPFADYLRVCTGEMPFDDQGVAEHLANNHGMQVIDIDQIVRDRPELQPDRAATEHFIRGQVEELLIEKGETRIAVEAEAYTVIRALATSEDPGSDLAFLSYGGFLNRIAVDGPSPLNRNVVVSPDALYPFLLRTGITPQAGTSFRELMLSNLFDSSRHFLDRETYTAYFAPLITEAESIYRQHEANLTDELRAQLMTGIDEIDPLYRPLFVSGLEARLAIELRDKDARVSAMETERAELLLRVTAAERDKKKAQELASNVEAARQRKQRKRAKLEARKRRRK